MQKTLAVGLLTALVSAQNYDINFDYAKNCDCRAFPVGSQGYGACMVHCCQDLYGGDYNDCTASGNSLGLFEQTPLALNHGCEASN